MGYPHRNSLAPATHERSPSHPPTVLPQGAPTMSPSWGSSSKLKDSKASASTFTGSAVLRFTSFFSWRPCTYYECAPTVLGHVRKCGAGDAGASLAPAGRTSTQCSDRASPMHWGFVVPSVRGRQHLRHSLHVALSHVCTAVPR